MNELQVVPEDIGKKIKELDEHINKAFRFTIHTAIKAGNLLKQAKEMLPHGSFTEWVKNETGISDRTARDYMSFADYADSIKIAKDLSEARSIIDKQKKAIDGLDRVRVSGMMEERKKSGKKPDGWDRQCDYEWDKRTKQQNVSKVSDMPEKSAPVPPTLATDDADDFFGVDEEEHPVFDHIEDIIAEYRDTDSKLRLLTRIIKHCRDMSLTIIQDK